MNLDNIVVSTQRGKEKKVYNGRFYRQESYTKGPYISADNAKATTYWVCCSTGCKGRMAEVQALDQLTGGAIGPPQFVVKESTHSTFCVPSVADIGRAQARKLVEETMLQGTSTLPQAIGNAVTLLRNQYGD